MRFLLSSLVTLMTVVCMMLLNGITIGSDSSPPAVVMADNAALLCASVQFTPRANTAEVVQLRGPTEVKAEVVGIRTTAKTYAVMPTTTIERMLATHIKLRQAQRMLATHIIFRQENRMLAGNVYFRHNPQAICGHIQLKVSERLINNNFA